MAHGISVADSEIEGVWSLKAEGFEYGYRSGQQSSKNQEKIKGGYGERP